VTTATDLRPAAVHWQTALDAAQLALGAAEPVLPAEDLNMRRRDLAAERLLVAAQLVALARQPGSRPPIRSRPQRRPESPRTVERRGRGTLRS